MTKQEKQEILANTQSFAITLSQEELRKMILELNKQQIELEKRKEAYSICFLDVINPIINSIAVRYVDKILESWHDNRVGLENKIKHIDLCIQVFQKEFNERERTLK